MHTSDSLHHKLRNGSIRGVEAVVDIKEDDMLGHGGDKENGSQWTNKGPNTKSNRFRLDCLGWRAHTTQRRILRLT